MISSYLRTAKVYSLILSLLFVPAILFSPGMGLAQSTTTGAINGRVVDPSRAVIPGATVTLKDTATGAERTTVTGANGTFHFAFLEPGNYTVSATATGFRTTTQPISVSVGQTKTADIELQVGQARQTVTVTTEVPLIQTNNGNVSSTVNELQIAQIPNPGNDLTFIAQMSPGTVANTGAGYGNVSLYGLPATSNTFTVNGMDNMDPLFDVNNSGATNLLLGQNDVKEATVVTNGYSGEYGGLAGASVNYVTKSGSNAFHGNANYYWNGRALNANSFFNNASNTPRPFVNANQWSASLGGPVIKDKIFFFVDQEGIKLVIPTSSQVLLPSNTFETGTIANLNSLGLSQSVPFYQNMFNLYNGAPGADRATPFETCGDAGVSGLPSSATCVNQFRSTVGQKTDQWMIASRLDFNIGSRDRVFVHGRVDRGHQASFSDPINSMFNLVSNQPGQQGQVGWTHLLGSNKVNSFHATLQYGSAIFSAPDLAKALQAFPTTMFMGDGSLTTLGGLDVIAPQGRNTTQYQFIDDFSWIHGNHNFKFGANFYRSDISDFDFGMYTSGELLPFSLNDLYNGGSTGSLLYQVFPTSLVQPFAYYRLGFYGQDEWRVAHNLKITLVLAGEHDSNPVCQHNCFAHTAQPFLAMNHDVNTPYNQAMLIGQHQEFESMTNIAWQPRLGFAWQPFGSASNFVVRGGAGFFSDGIPGLTMENIAENPPYFNSFYAFDNNIATTQPSNLFADTASYNAGFLSQFASGGTLDSISASVPGFSPPNLYSAIHKMKLPQYQKWNLEIEKGFGPNTMVSINYVGNHGIHEMVPNTSINGFDPSGFVGMPLSPIDQRFATVNYLESAGVSSYNGVTVSFRHNFSRGLVTANYTYGHALDILSNGGSTLPFIYNTNISTISPQNPFDIAANYGNADYDNRHNFNMSYVYDLPIKSLLFGHGWNTLVNGWQISGTLFTHTGFPYTVENGNAENNLSGLNFGAPIYATYTNYPEPLKPCDNPDRPCLYPQQFLPPSSDPGHFGIQGRNMFFGPGYFDTDFGIKKITSLPYWESAKLSLGFQFYNLLNHPNFDQPIANLADSQFGSIINTVSPPTSIFGSFLGADASPRLIQVRATLSF